MANPHDETGELTPPVPHYLSITSRILDAIAWLCMLLAGISLVVIIVTFGWLVYGRYILDNTPTWVEQLSLLLIAYITFLGAAVGVRRNTHLSIDFIRESLPPHPRLVLRYVSDLMVLAFGVGMAWQGWILDDAGYRSGHSDARHARNLAGSAHDRLRRADRRLLSLSTSPPASPALTEAEASWPWDWRFFSAFSSSA